MINVIDKLNKMRLERNLSVYRLAELSGINQSTLANTFSRGTLPSIKHLELICDTLGVSLSQFFVENESTIYLSAEELTMIKNYRKLPEKIKKPIREIITSSAENIL